ncbi:MAG: RodZ domain-containing protein [Acetobacter sp.]|uniref:helix-turn-helix domain-containing protein n=1 Tax=Acetobacter sp. TaxID=440 RepID=UPI0039E7700B
MAEHAHGAEQGQDIPPHVLPDVATLGVGRALRERREQLGWSLADVSEWLRIRDVYLGALESGQHELLPAEVYALGFLRTYGQALGFDPAVLINRYRQETRAVAHKPVLDFPDPVPDRRLPPAVSISLGLVVVLASYVGWYCFVGRSSPLPEHVPPVASLMQGEATHNVPSPQVASLLPEHAVPLPQRLAPSVADAAAHAVEQGQAGSSASDATQAAPANSPAAQAVAPANGQGALAPLAAPPPPASPVAGSSEAQAPSAPPVAQAVPDDQIVVKALAASWVQVKDEQGKTVYDHVLQPDEEWTVPASGGPYSLTVGNAGGIVVQAGSVTTPPLGRNGAVRRHLALNAQAVRDGSLATASAAPVAGGAGQPTSRVPGHETQAAEAPQGAAPAVVPAAAPAAPVAPPVSSVADEPSADDLNARQLQGTDAR